MTKDLYTIADIAEQIDVTVRSVRRLINLGELPATKMCGKYVVTAENLKAFIDGKAGQRVPSGGGGSNGK